MNLEGKRAVALVSGGLDSVVSLAKAVATLDVRLVIFFNYGQRALLPERAAVVGVVNFYGLAVQEVDLGWLGLLLPDAMRLGRVGGALDTLDAVWVPNRNGVFLNVAAAYAEKYGCDVVVTGFNREEAAEFPDNGAEYTARVNRGLELSTRNAVRVMSFTQDLDKREILELGLELGAPLSVIWSCYEAGERMCGRCGSCKRLKNALGALPADLKPPLEFAG
ncbi:MAG: 7-cyano-7-deazaguanine synthase [bacterium]